MVRKTTFVLSICVWKRCMKGSKAALPWPCHCLCLSWSWSCQASTHGPVLLEPWTLTPAPRAPVVPGSLLSLLCRCWVPHQLPADQGGCSCSSLWSQFGAYMTWVPCLGLSGWVLCSSHTAAPWCCAVCRSWGTAPPWHCLQTISCVWWWKWCGHNEIRQFPVKFHRKAVSLLTRNKYKSKYLYTSRQSAVWLFE